MAVNIYDELEALSGQLGLLAGRLKALEDRAVPKLLVAPVTYVYPGIKFDTFLAKGPALCQINPASGPGAAVDPNYVAQVNKARALHVPVFGYVHTKYSARPLAEVKADVEKYTAWYGVSGIFVDTTSNKPEHLPYYVELCGWLRLKGLRIVLNPGTRTLEEHFKLADYVMCAETDLATYLGQSARPAFEALYREKCWHVIHSCPAAEMPATVALAKQRGAGLVYVTDDVMANPYDKLPTYWDDLCNTVSAIR